jgi:PAS domain S-box-containing protein
MIWLNISSIGWCCFAPFAVLLSWVLTADKKYHKFLKWYYYLFIFIIPGIFIYQQWAGHLITDLVKLSYGWMPVWSSSLWPRLYFAFYISFTIFALCMPFSSYKKKSYYEKKQLQIILLSASLFFIASTVTQVLLRHNFIPPIGVVFSVIFSAGIVYAMTKYSFLSLTSSYAAANIISTMSDLLILADSGGKIIEVNKSLIKLLGYSRFELIGSLMEKLNPSVKWPDVFKEESFRNKQVVLITKNSENIPINLSGSVMKDSEGNYIGIVCVGRDMRELQRLQERELELSSEKVRTEALLERAWKLQEAYDRLMVTQDNLIQSEKMAAVGQLAGAVAHEINDPMGRILLNVRDIEKKLDKDDLICVQLKSIEDEALKCRRLIGDLLSFAMSERSEAEKR